MEGATERRTQNNHHSMNHHRHRQHGVSIVVSRVPSKGRTVRLAVAARVPRKRAHVQDKVCFSLVHYSFLDDARRFTNLDALLTRLAPVSVIHISSTEHVNVKQNSNPSKVQLRKVKEVEDMLTRLASVVDSRTDLGVTDNDDIMNASAEEHIMPVAHVLPNLPKCLATPASTQTYLDGLLTHLLGGEGSEGHLAYRGEEARWSSEESFLRKRAMGLLLYGENMSINNENEGVDATIGSYRTEAGVLSSHLSLDRTASEAIHLLPPANPNSGHAKVDLGGTARNNSLFGVLNQCQTRMGSRTLQVWLRQPLIDHAAILQRQDAVATLVDNGLERDCLRDEGLHGLSNLDLDALSTRLAAFGDEIGGGSTEQALEGLYKLYLFADRQLPVLVDALQHVVKDENNSMSPREEGPQEPENQNLLKASLEGLNRVTLELSRAAQLVEAVLDLDAAPRNFMVQASHDEQLGDVRADLDSTDAELDALHAEMNELWSETSGQPEGQVRLEAGDDGTTWQFRLPKTNDSKVLQNQLGHVVKVHRLLKNGVYFSTKELRQLGTKKQDLLVEYDRLQRDIVKNAMSVACTYVPVLERASLIVADIDVLASLAAVAALSPNGYCRPIMTDGEEDGLGIELKEARHPCVELQESVDYIPNDINLVFGSSSFLLVTGPNMGGKSTYIRCLGAIVAMAQIGSFVPCTSAKINIVHHILARVGAGDVQDRGISTFMAEMLEASSILRTATKRSLIIIDEMGRGTSTFDGFGLAKAISEYIVQRLGCMTVFATHFHELTTLEEQESAVTNCHVTAQRRAGNNQGLTFLYEVRPGPCLESFGIQVAEMANVPAAVIADAKLKARQLENFQDTHTMTSSKKQKVDASEDDHADAEEAAAAIQFIHKFKKLPLQSFHTLEEKRAAVAKLLLQ